MHSPARPTLSLSLTHHHLLSLHPPSTADAAPRHPVQASRQSLEHHHRTRPHIRRKHLSILVHSRAIAEGDAADEGKRRAPDQNAAEEHPVQKGRQRRRRLDDDRQVEIHLLAPILIVGHRCRWRGDRDQFWPFISAARAAHPPVLWREPERACWAADLLRDELLRGAPRRPRRWRCPIR